MSEKLTDLEPTKIKWEEFMTKWTLDSTALLRDTLWQTEDWSGNEVAWAAGFTGVEKVLAEEKENGILRPQREKEEVVKGG